MKQGMAMLASLVLLGGFTSTSGLAATDEFEATVADLRPYFRKEGLNLADYDAVLLGTMGLDDARVIPPPWYEGESSSPEKWKLTDGDIRWLRSSYRKAMRDEIEVAGGYPIVDVPAAGVLNLDIEIIALMPYARKGEDVKTRGFGEILVQAQFRDALSGELLAIYEGKQSVGSEYQQNTRLNAENDLRSLFQVWGKRVRLILDDAYGK
jgi:hypothetical protein